LDSYTPERRGATLDVFANASKSARFMTPPTRGWEVMRDAALNLALSHPFAGQLANPRQMTPYTYGDSPVVCTDDPGFTGGPKAGAMLPETRLGDGYLTEKLGTGFSLIVFDECFAQELDIAGVEVILIDPACEAAQGLSAKRSSAYLVRPDLHIAARWLEATPAAVQHALKIATGEAPL
jgi:3-(3-hydroxy-phenyl)propionate hydroxylase